MPSKLAKWIKHDPLPSSSYPANVRPNFLQRSRHPPQATFQPVLRLILPHDGVGFMNPTEEARIHAQMNQTEPAYDYVLTGQLEVEPPTNCPQFRCHAIRVRFESLLKPDRPTSVVQEEVLFERELKIAESDEKGILIDGLQRFEFTLILPNTIPPRDWGEWGCIENELYATLEGVEIEGSASTPLISPPVTPSTSSFFTFGRKRSDVRESAAAPKAAQPPPTAGSSTSVPWLEGNHVANMTIRLIYNPDPAGGVHSLNETAKGQAKGLGEYDVRMYSDVWTIASLLRVSIALMDIPPTATVFYIAVHLVQTTVVSLSKDSEQREQTFNKRFLLMDKGQAVEKHHLHPEISLPALYRGKAAGGNDVGELILEMHGRVMENDFVARPSTLPSILTPARTTHALEVAIFFSCWGEDAFARPMHTPGPGGLRLMKVRKPVMLPCCSILPAVVRLPSYADDEAEPTEESSHLYMVCSCHMSMDEVQARMRAAIEQQEKTVASDAQRLVQMKDLERA